MALETYRRARQRAMNVSFRDDALMNCPPSCTLEAFRKPLLRQCPLDPDTISWEDRLGGGLDGYVWKVKFGDQGPFALKLFFDKEPLQHLLTYHAIQRECHNAALLQMIETSVAQATPESPIVINANPTTREDAQANLYAFSEDGRLRLQNWFSEASMPTTTISQVPRMRQCYGWLSFNSAKVYEAPSSMWAQPFYIDKIRRCIEPKQNYLAIVYEYVEEGENDTAAVEQVLEFLWLAGFSLTGSPLEKNWKSGVLIDLADIVAPKGFGWEKRLYGKKDAEHVLQK